MGLVLVRASVWSTEQVSLAMHHCALGSLLLGTGEGGGRQRKPLKDSWRKEGGGAKLESGSGCKCSRGYCRSLFVCVYLLECGGVAKVEVSGAVCLRLPPPTLLKLV